MISLTWVTSCHAAPVCEAFTVTHTGLGFSVIGVKVIPREEGKLYAPFPGYFVIVREEEPVVGVR